MAAIASRWNADRSDAPTLSVGFGPCRGLGILGQFRPDIAEPAKGLWGDCGNAFVVFAVDLDALRQRFARDELPMAWKTKERILEAIGRAAQGDDPATP